VYCSSKRFSFCYLVGAANYILGNVKKGFCPTKERNGTWRIKTNDELDELLRHKHIINHIKSKILSWFGHLNRMPEERMVKKYTSGNRC
jgi:predicted transcriptional regulator